MTYEEIANANQAINKTQIKGKDYAEVNQRIKAFRMIEPDGAIETEMLSNIDGVCVFRAVVRSGAGSILGTGTAYEKESSSFINKTSYIENCETSAVGRALGMCGLGIDVRVASFEEVANAIENQGAKNEPVKEAELRAQVIGYTNRHNMSKESIEKICKCYGVEKLNQLNAKQCEHYIKALEAKGGNINE